MIQVNSHRKKIKSLLIPECWDELTGEQLVAVANILYTEQTFEAKRDLRLARAIFGLSWDEMKTIPGEIICYEIFPLIQWVFEGCNLTKQLLPVLEIDGVKYYGPDTCMQNLRLCEFAGMDRYLGDWHSDTDNIESLYSFIATLYRPAKQGYDIELNPDGDVREAYNGNLTASYAKRMMQHVDIDVAFAILLWVKGCRDFITKQFPDVFVEGESTEAPEPGYFGLMRAIAKEGIHGKFEDVEQMYIYNAFLELEKVAEERAALEAAMEEAKNKNK